MKKPSPRGRPWALRHAYGRTWQASVALLLGSAIVLTLCGIAAPAYSVSTFRVRAPPAGLSRCRKRPGPRDMAWGGGRRRRVEPRRFPLPGPAEWGGQDPCVVFADRLGGGSPCKVRASPRRSASPLSTTPTDQRPGDPATSAAPNPRPLLCA